jgi:hypothetical protein
VRRKGNSEKASSDADHVSEQSSILLLLGMPDAIDADWLLYIFYFSVPRIFEREIGVPLQLIVNTPGNVYLARFCEPFQSSRDIDAVAIYVAFVDYHVTGVYADAQLYPPIGVDPAIAPRQFLLYFEPAVYRVRGAVELD